MRQLTRRVHEWVLPIALVALALPAVTNAQDWNFEPTVRATAETNDNVRLLREDQDPIDSEALALDVTARMIRRAPLSEVRIIPRVQVRDFSDSDVEDTQGFFLDLFAERDLRRGQFGIEVRASREDVLNAEIGDPDFDNPDVNDPIDLDTGRIQVDDERDRLIVDPFFGFSLTERLGIGVEARYLAVDYAQTSEVSDLRDYNSADLTTELNYSISERGELTVGVFVSDFESEDGPSRN